MASRFQPRPRATRGPRAAGCGLRPGWRRLDAIMLLRTKRYWSEASPPIRGGQVLIAQVPIPPHEGARRAPMDFRQRNSQRFEMDMSAAEVKRATTATYLSQPKSWSSTAPKSWFAACSGERQVHVGYPGGPCSTSTMRSISRTRSNMYWCAMNRRPSTRRRYARHRRGRRRAGHQRRA